MLHRCRRYRAEWRRYPAVMAAAAAAAAAESRRRFIRTCGARVRRSLSAVGIAWKLGRNLSRKEKSQKRYDSYVEDKTPQIYYVRGQNRIVRRRRRRDNDYRRARPERRRGHLRVNVRYSTRRRPRREIHGGKSVDKSECYVMLCSAHEITRVR